MITVLITRALHQAAEFQETLQQNGFIPILFPMIEIIPADDWTACDAAIESLYMYDGVIFTSANGVDFFLKRLGEKGLTTQTIRKKLLCVVGEKTKAVCQKYGLEVTFMPEKFTSNELFHALRQQDVRDRIFLHPRGNLGKEQLSGQLRSFGARVDPVIVYQTISPEPEELEPIKRRILSGEIDVLTFTSPSTIKNFVGLFSPAEFHNSIAQLPAIVIGPVTEKAAVSSGFKNIIASQVATMDGILEELVRHTKK